MSNRREIRTQNDNSPQAPESSSIAKMSGRRRGEWNISLNQYSNKSQKTDSITKIQGEVVENLRKDVNSRLRKSKELHNKYEKIKSNLIKLIKSTKSTIDTLHNIIHVYDNETAQNYENCKDIISTIETEESNYQNFDHVVNDALRRAAALGFPPQEVAKQYERMGYNPNNMYTESILRESSLSQLSKHTRDCNDIQQKFYALVKEIDQELLLVKRIYRDANLFVTHDNTLQNLKIDVLDIQGLSVEIKRDLTDLKQKAGTNLGSQLQEQQPQQPHLFPGRYGAKLAWEGARELVDQRILWTRPMIGPLLLPQGEPFVLACVQDIVLAHV
jgi:hypothetical protein